MRNILRDACNGIAAFFAQVGWWWYGLGFKASGIPYVNRLEDNFYDVGNWFDEIAWTFITLRDSLLRIYDKAEEILTWEYIWQEITVRLPDLSMVAEWVEHAFEMITGVITFWWDYMSVTVHGWIDEAVQLIGDVWELVKENVEGLIQQAVAFIGETITMIRTQLNAVESAWTDFSTVVLPTLLSSIQIDDLIRSWLKSYEPFWEGWQDVKDKVDEFFTDPENWLYKAADRIIERFW